MNQGFNPPDKKVSVSIGSGTFDGKTALVLLNTGAMNSHSVLMTPGYARFVAQQLIQWAEFVEQSSKQMGT